MSALSEGRIMELANDFGDVVKGAVVFNRDGQYSVQNFARAIEAECKQPAQEAKQDPIANADFCPHCNPCRNGERIAKAERLNEDYDDVLRGLASYVGCGGFNTLCLIDPKVADEKIRWGFDHIETVEKSRAAPAPCANAEPVAFLYRKTEFGGLYVDHLPTPAPDSFPVFDHAKPCERCAELEARLFDAQTEANGPLELAEAKLTEAERQLTSQKFEHDRAMQAVCAALENARHRADEAERQRDELQRNFDSLHETTSTIQQERDDAREQRDEAMKDAERYRFLKGYTNAMLYPLFDANDDRELDAAIDAARKEGEKS